jgi:hypothetical protein
VCRRSTTTCATCLHFRRGIASGLGLCGLDARRTALDGTEIRACWVAATPVHADAGADGVPARELVMAGPADTARRAPRTFVPVEELGSMADRAPGSASWTDATEPGPDGTPGGRNPADAATPASGWSLWGDPEA